MKYFFDKNNVCIGVQNNDDIGGIEAEHVIETDKHGLFDPNAGGVIHNNKRYGLGVLKKQGNDVVIDLSVVAEIDNNAYKIQRNPQRAVDKAMVKELNLPTYPEIGEQLDLLYQDIENGTLDTSGKFYQTIHAVKKAIPKPTK